MMNDNSTTTESPLRELRKRSKSGFLSQITNPVTPIKTTAEIEIPEEDYQALIAIILDD